MPVAFDLRSAVISTVNSVISIKILDVIEVLTKYKNYKTLKSSFGFAARPQKNYYETVVIKNTTCK